MRAWGWRRETNAHVPRCGRVGPCRAPLRHRRAGRRGAGNAGGGRAARLRAGDELHSPRARELPRDGHALGRTGPRRGDRRRRRPASDAVSRTAGAERSRPADRGHAVRPLGDRAGGPGGQDGLVRARPHRGCEHVRRTDGDRARDQRGGLVGAQLRRPRPGARAGARGQLSINRPGPARLILRTDSRFALGATIFRA